MKSSIRYYNNVDKYGSRYITIIILHHRTIIFSFLFLSTLSVLNINFIRFYLIAVKDDLILVEL